MAVMSIPLANGFDFGRFVETVRPKADACARGKAFELTGARMILVPVRYWVFTQERTGNLRRQKAREPLRYRQP